MKEILHIGVSTKCTSGNHWQISLPACFQSVQKKWF